jgi:2-haloalkanoic acid dehalogenase type II
LKSAPIKLLTFDLDDTLWPCKPTIIAAENCLYDWLQQNVSEITQRYDATELRLKRRDLCEQNPELAHDMSLLRIESFKVLAEEFGLPHDWIQQAFDVFYLARQQVTLFDDVAPILDSLKTKYRLAALTNGNADIEKTGVSHWFEFALSAAEVGQAKPHPDFFDKVLERAEVAAAEIVHIGDDQHHDVFGASQAGIRTVWVNRYDQSWQHAECEADVHISSLAELPDVLEELIRGSLLA